MDLTKKILDEVCRHLSQLCILGGNMNLADMENCINKIIEDNKMAEEKEKKSPITKSTPSKWQLDKNWNVNSLDGFFPISDLNFVQFRAEQDGTYTVTMVIGTFVTGRLFGKNKTEAKKFAKMLMTWKRQYQQAIKKHHSEHHNILQEVLKLQKIATKHK